MFGLILHYVSDKKKIIKSFSLQANIQNCLQYDQNYYLNFELIYQTCDNAQCKMFLHNISNKAFVSNIRKRWIETFSGNLT